MGGRAPADLAGGAVDRAGGPALGGHQGRAHEALGHHLRRQAVSTAIAGIWVAFWVAFFAERQQQSCEQADRYATHSNFEAGSYYLRLLSGAGTFLRNQMAIIHQTLTGTTSDYETGTWEVRFLTEIADDFRRFICR